MVLGYFKLDRKANTAVPCNVHEWAEAFSIENRRVAQMQVGQFWVSTVFLGIDHSFGHGPPQLFETMIFHEDDMGGEYQKRSETWADAELEHNRAVSIAHERMRKAEQVSASIGSRS